MQDSTPNAKQPPTATPFLHVGGTPAIDFVDTEIVDHGQRIDLLTHWEDVARWAHESGLITKSQATDLARRVPASRHQSELQRLRDLRAALRRALEIFAERGTLTPQSLAPLNAALAGDESRDTFAIIGGRLTLRREIVAITPAQLLALIARSAAELFATANPSRVRPCANDACILWFHDTSKGGTRRWCSMEGCGNRAKVAAHAQRERSTER
ncbi:MAG: CGNR zinc finger domain-containing protein [Phycisphaerales bacterium]|nr:CGNR zinc finger domain-containing protein [Phycisphaerales bacterium]